MAKVAAKGVKLRGTMEKPPNLTDRNHDLENTACFGGSVGNFPVLPAPQSCKLPREMKMNPNAWFMRAGFTDTPLQCVWTGMAGSFFRMKIENSH